MAGERPITPGQALLAVKAAGVDSLPRNAKRSADAQLDQLRQAVAAERVKARDLETQLEAARLEVEGAARAVTDAYAEDDAKARGTASSGTAGGRG